MAGEVHQLLLSLGIVSVLSSQGPRHHKVIVSGTADYANLHGRGTWSRSFAPDGSLVFSCPGRVHFD